MGKVAMMGGEGGSNKRIVGLPVHNSEEDMLLIGGYRLIRGKVWPRGAPLKCFGLALSGALTQQGGGRRMRPTSVACAE